jgi:hypothetical protein
MGKSEIKMEEIPLSDRKERAKETGFMQQCSFINQCLEHRLQKLKSTQRKHTQFNRKKSGVYYGRQLWRCLHP